MGFFAGLALVSLAFWLALGLGGLGLGFGLGLAFGLFLFLGGDLVGRGLGHQLDRFGDPIVVLDGAVELELLVEPGDLVVGEIGDLLELDQAELVQLLLELGRDAGDQLEIVGLALRLLEALEGVFALALHLLALGDAGRLAAPAAQIIELGPAHPAAPHHLDRVDQRRMDREDALDALAIGNLAHGEILVQPAARAADADALIGLHARALAFDHLDVDAQRVAGTEFGDFAFLGERRSLLFFELLDDIHGNTFRWAPALARGLPANAILFD